MGRIPLNPEGRITGFAYKLKHSANGCPKAGNVVEFTANTSNINNANVQAAQQTCVDCGSILQVLRSVGPIIEYPQKAE
jgi:hypothetical protein